MKEGNIQSQYIDEHSTNPQPGSGIGSTDNNQAVPQEHLARDQPTPSANAVDANILALGDIINDKPAVEGAKMEKTSYKKLMNGVGWFCAIIALSYVNEYLLMM